MYELMSFSQYAKYKNFSQAYISKLVKKGIISKNSIFFEGKRPKIAPIFADRDLEQHYGRKSKTTKHDDFLENFPDIEMPDKIEINPIPDDWFE
jgi:hypothetical protein